MPIFKINKKGQTLIEVVAALGIVFIVFATTAALTINALNLVLKSRDKTEAIYLAQQEIAVFENKMTETCSLPSASSNRNGVDSTTGLYYSVVSDTNDIDYLPISNQTPTTNLNLTENPSNLGFNHSYFVEINATISYVQNGTAIYQTTAYVGSNLTND